MLTHRRDHGCTEFKTGQPIGRGRRWGDLATHCSHKVRELSVETDSVPTSLERVLFSFSAVVEYETAFTPNDLRTSQRA